MTEVFRRIKIILMQMGSVLSLHRVKLNTLGAPGAPNLQQGRCSFFSSHLMVLKMPEKIYLDTRQAAELLTLSARTLEKMRLEGRGPDFRKLGRRVVYHLADLESWAESGRRTSTSDTGPECKEGDQC